MSQRRRRSSSQNREDQRPQMHAGQPRYSSEQKGKGRDMIYSLATCLDRAPMSSDRSTLFMDDNPYADHGEHESGRLVTGGARRISPSPKASAPTRVSTSAHPFPLVRPTNGADKVQKPRAQEPNMPAGFRVPQLSISRSPAPDEAPRPNQSTRINTPAFGGSVPSLRASSPHWSIPVYERQLMPKALGYPLAVPTGLRIGDVCYLASNGKFQKAFNITVPIELPHYFSVLHPPLSIPDICKYQDFAPKSHIASRSLQQVRDDSAFAGLAFRCDLDSEAAVLVFPQGAVTTELIDVSRFRDFIAANATNWVRYQQELEASLGERVELRLVTSTLTAPFWANAVVCSDAKTGSVLKFAETKTVDGRNAYAWDTRGFARAAVNASDSWNPASRDDCTSVKCFSITPRRQMNTVDPQAGDGLKSRDPCTVLNKKMLSMNPRANIVASHDQDWCAVLRDTDVQFPDDSEILRRVFERHDILCEEDVAFLQWKSTEKAESTPEDLMKEIDQLRASLDGMGEEDAPRRSNALHAISTNIVNYVRSVGKHKKKHWEVLLTVAINNAKEEVALLTAKQKLTASSLHLLASTYLTAFEKTDDLKLLDQAISTYRKALAVDPKHQDSMADLATSLWSRYGRYKQQKDLDELIELYKALLFSRPVNHPDEVKWLNSIGMGMWERYRRSNDRADMDAAVAYLRRASRSYPTPCDPYTLSNLGNALLARSRHRHDIFDLNEALLHYRNALLSVSPLHPGRSAFLSNLADALLDRYDRTSDLADLNEAVRAYEKTLELPSPHHRDRVTCTLLFANALQTRFRKTFDIDDLKLSIKKYHEAKRRSGPSHPSYAKVSEQLLLAEQEQSRLDTLTRTPSLPPLSPQSPRSGHSITPAPKSPISRNGNGHGPTKSDWMAQHQLPPPSSLTSNASKFRIVRPPMKKPYSRSKTSSPTSDTEGGSTTPGSPRLPPRARRHHTLGHLP
ncbi:hypothetical protein FA15DRAFT_673072 [Coprinopsis marcescibilis]|uniref:TPR-like protein n=1 Tax=Coprinopsis marcescibilis TaxID=230819 RepID=A0A5C3KL67_COPMA|nr:hypothetical protein FA15DRAFT_673072 [Coprinopsis marcescibilis]